MDKDIIKKWEQLYLETFFEETSSAVSEVGIQHARVHAAVYKKLLQEKAGIAVTENDEIENFKVFSFFVWACAFVIWGNIQNPSIRGRLVYDTHVKVASAVAYELSSDKSISDIVYLTEEMLKEYQLYRQILFIELPVLIDKGYEETVETTLLVGLGWLRRLHEVKTSRHKKIEKAFLKNRRVQKGLTEIEHIAFDSVFALEDDAG